MALNDVTDIKRPVPKPSDELVYGFWDQCQSGILHFQCCLDCASWRHPPRYMCPECGSFEWQWSPSKGRGKLFSWTVSHRPMHPGYADLVPYTAIVVELEEGVRMVSGVRDMSSAELKLEQPLKVLFERINDDMLLPFFRPA